MVSSFKEVPWEKVRSDAGVIEVAQALIGTKRLAVDTETTSLDAKACRLILLQLATPERGYVIDGSLDLAPLREIFASRDTLKVMHNARYDVPVLHYSVGMATNRVACTLELERLVVSKGPRQGCGLKDVSQRRLGVELDKSVRLDFGDANIQLTDRHYEYAAKDALVLLPILSLQERDLRAYGLVAQSVARMQALSAELSRLWELASDEVARELASA